MHDFPFQIPSTGGAGYWPDSGLEAGFGAVLGFFAGLETPKHKRKKLNPLRSESSKLIVPILSTRKPTSGPVTAA